MGFQWLSPHLMFRITMCKCVCVCASVCLWGSEDNPRSQSLGTFLFVSLFQTASLIVLELQQAAGAICLCLCLPLTITEITSMATASGFISGFWGWMNFPLVIIYLLLFIVFYYLSHRVYIPPRVLYGSTRRLIWPGWELRLLEPSYMPDLCGLQDYPRIGDSELDYCITSSISSDVCGTEPQCCPPQQLQRPWDQPPQNQGAGCRQQRILAIIRDLPGTHSAENWAGREGRKNLKSSFQGLRVWLGETWHCSKKNRKWSHYLQLSCAKSGLQLSRGLEHSQNNVASHFRVHCWGYANSKGMGEQELPPSKGLSPMAPLSPPKYKKNTHSLPYSHCLVPSGTHPLLLSLETGMWPQQSIAEENKGLSSTRSGDWLHSMRHMEHWL